MQNPSENPTGTILHLQRLSTEDGPGIRTTVFYKGCSLRCRWCHNPESILLHPQVQWLENRCIGCQSCVDVCPSQCLSFQPEGIRRDRKLCTACGLCVEACPGGAMELLGKKVDADGLIKELLKDRAYFDKSGGGVTLSGGEPTLQPDFTLSLAQKLHHAGVQIALDTCGVCSPSILDRILPYVDVILYDLKCMETTAHTEWTGRPNDLILENMIWLAARIRKDYPAMRLWVRTPLIPGATATQENITAVGTFLARETADVLERWELCAFNNLCRDKYRRLEMEWGFLETPLMSSVELKQIENWAKASGIDPKKVFVTGAARVEN